MENQSKPKILLPVIALILSLSPVPVLAIFTFIPFVGVFGALFATLALIAGIILGIISLTKRNEIGVLGRVIAICAIVFSLLPIIVIVLFYIGAMTGVISLM